MHDKQFKEQKDVIMDAMIPNIDNMIAYQTTSTQERIMEDVGQRLGELNEELKETIVQHKYGQKQIRIND